MAITQTRNVYRYIFKPSSEIFEPDLWHLQVLCERALGPIRWLRWRSVHQHVGERNTAAVKALIAEYEAGTGPWAPEPPPTPPPEPRYFASEPAASSPSNSRRKAA